MTASPLRPHDDSRIAWARITDAGTFVTRWLRRAGTPACRRKDAASADEDEAAEDVRGDADRDSAGTRAAPPGGVATAGRQGEIAAPMVIREVSARRGVSTGTW
ncbi:hypothetical protein GCM10010156_51070 [Planobispora rosea]|uniref:Uncharacterized protein n=1 Tax=Planobispora rosea TaxID=35762 RepID=A0A8J3SC16_PLARO|nr:hypothetical protein GCM10010156_51070 [Planobispora rosea]GIH89019.1 hypothetical protein Pro02_74270 [Planobispora rosea]